MGAEWTDRHRSRRRGEFGRIFMHRESTCSKGPGRGDPDSVSQLRISTPDATKLPIDQGQVTDARKPTTEPAELSKPVSPLEDNKKSACVTEGS
jgi:hypothetical protein